MSIKKLVAVAAWFALPNERLQSVPVENPTVELASRGASDKPDHLM